MSENDEKITARPPSFTQERPPVSQRGSDSTPVSRRSIRVAAAEVASKPMPTGWIAVTLAVIELVRQLLLHWPF